MVKKTLALLFLLSFQARSESELNIENEQNVECITQQTENSVFRKKKKCKCFCCINAICAKIKKLIVTGDQTIGGDLAVTGNVSIDGTLEIGGVPILSGATGATGATGAIGLTGPTGATGETGATGLGLTTYGNFYAIMPGDNADTVAAGTAVDFPQDGPSSLINRASASEFILPDIGTYEINWQVSVTEAGQLVLWLDSGAGAIQLDETVVGRATGTSQIVGNTLITTSVVNSVLSVRNPTGNTPALTITVGDAAMGGSPVSATLTIKRLS